MSSQPNDQSTVQSPGSSQESDDFNKTGVQTHAAPPAKVAPTNPPKPMPNPI